MIPASYLFKNAYRGAWGTSQVETEDESARRLAIRRTAELAACKQFAVAATARSKTFAGKVARALAIALYRWSRGGAYAGIAGRAH